MSEMKPDAGNLEQQLLEMRWRCLSLAADLDRLERGPAERDLSEQLAPLHAAIAALLQPGGNRAERVQMLFSDQTP